MIHSLLCPHCIMVALVIGIPLISSIIQRLHYRHKCKCKGEKHERECGQQHQG